MNHPHRPFIVWVSCAVGACCLMGCQILPQRSGTDEEMAPVTKIISMWQPAQRDTGGTSQSGYAGQLWFLRGDAVPQPVSAEVQLLMYQQQEEKWVLRQEYQYTAEAWQTHERETPLGTVYQVFLPTEPRAATAVRVKYVNADGRPVFSDVVTLLSGAQAKSGTPVSPVTP